MLNEYPDEEHRFAKLWFGGDIEGRIDDDTGFVIDEEGCVTVTLPEAEMEGLERLAAVNGRSVEEQAKYIMKVVLGLCAPDSNDRIGRLIVMMQKRARSHHPLNG